MWNRVLGNYIIKVKQDFLCISFFGVHKKSFCFSKKERKKTDDNDRHYGLAWRIGPIPLRNADDE